MYKEQQIEEMATAISNYSEKYDWNLFKFQCENFAIVLYNLGYRKIDDDCDVITKSELKQYKAQAVKEFAEKVEQAIVDNTYPYFDKNGKPVNIWNTEGFDKIDELLKE